MVGGQSLGGEGLQGQDDGVLLGPSVGHDQRPPEGNVYGASDEQEGPEEYADWLNERDQYIVVVRSNDGCPIRKFIGWSKAEGWVASQLKDIRLELDFMSSARDEGSWVEADCGPFRLSVDLAVWVVEVVRIPHDRGVPCVS